MYFGMRHGGFHGTPEKLLHDMLPAVWTKGQVLLRPKAASLCGDKWLHAYIAGRKAATIWMPEGEYVSLALPIPIRLSQLAVTLLIVGACGESAYEFTGVQLDFEEDCAKRFRLTWDAPLQYADDAAGVTSGWDLDGLRRFSNCAPVHGYLTRGALTFDLTDAAGTRTAVLYSTGREIARGFRVGDGILTLSESNGSGVSGSVTIAYLADLTAKRLQIRWPVRYRVLWDEGAAAIPSVILAHLDDDGCSNSFAYNSLSNLAAGTYRLTVRAESDTGKFAANVDWNSVTIRGVPNAPSALAYVSGNAAGGITLSFTKPDETSTYRLYVSGVEGVATCGQPLDTENVEATAIAGATQIVSGAIAGSPGTLYAVVRAVNTGGYEEKNGERIEVEFDGAGAVVGARPNSPSIVTIARGSTGRKFTVTAAYPTPRQKAAAATLRLYYRVEGGAWDYNTYLAKTLPTDAINGIKTVTFAELTLPADAWYELGVRARTTAGQFDVDTLGTGLLCLSEDDAPVTPENQVLVPQTG